MVYNRIELWLKNPVMGNSLDIYSGLYRVSSNSEAGMIADKRNGSLENEVVLADEQKRCSLWSQETKNYLLIHKALQRDCKERNTNLAAAWKNYIKSDDLIRKYLEMFGVAKKIARCFTESMKKWELGMGKAFHHLFSFYA